MEKWTNEKYNEFLEKLKAKQDKSYLEFNQKIVGKTKYQMIGVRTPILESFAKEIKKTDVSSFLSFVSNTYYEEVLLEGFLIASIKEDKEKYLKTYVKKIDNWALCDMTVSRIKEAKKEQEKYFPFVLSCLKSKREFTVRFGFVFLLTYYMEDEYLSMIFSLIQKYQQEKYYVQMAIAWLLSYTYLVDKEKTLSFLKEGVLSSFTYQKTISKIRESRRVPEDAKENLKKLNF